MFHTAVLTEICNQTELLVSKETLALQKGRSHFKVHTIPSSFNKLLQFASIDTPWFVIGVYTYPGEWWFGVPD